jgi:hypothetical protein
MIRWAGQGFVKGEGEEKKNREQHRPLICVGTKVLFLGWLWKNRGHGLVWIILTLLCFSLYPT